MTEVLSKHDIDCVKWDHNRDVIEGGSGATAGRPAVRAQTRAATRSPASTRARARPTSRRRAR
ncbi:hypothetical protein ACPPVO_44780 [Dactylosporangium sp. McL0621]|uniref:hypothetical protein n=1 Tax=Dactylosporangium sp. McL0621 TaxID=3415678 RepID=UPI003CEF56A1